MWGWWDYNKKPVSTLSKTSRCYNHRIETHLRERLMNRDTPMTETPDLNVLHWVKTWFTALTRPNEATYAGLIEGVRGRRTIASLWVVTGAFVAAILTMLTYPADMTIVMLAMVCSMPVFAVVYLLLTVLTAWSATRIAARITGSTDVPANFDTQMVALGMVTAPMSMLIALAYLFPYGSWIAYLLILYWAFLTVLAIKVVNHLDWQQAATASSVFLVLVVLALVGGPVLGILAARLPGNQ
jgi:hypothetical protein